MGVAPSLAPKTQDARRKVTLERIFQAPIEEVWDLWTTTEGIESWWGPDGFAVKVHKLDLRPGGELVYAMTATAPDQIDFLKKAGMPKTTESRLPGNAFASRILIRVGIVWSRNTLQR